jgi:hypothetical protein
MRQAVDRREQPAVGVGDYADSSRTWQASRLEDVEKCGVGAVLDLRRSRSARSVRGQWSWPASAAACGSPAPW